MTKILLVEDNEINRDMLSYRLNRRGYELLIAVDGAQAVSLATTENPDLILMDLSLPIMNGWEATRAIKANPDTQNIPIIALTAHAMSGDRQQALEAGCDDYDTKPIEFPRLLKKMQTLLEKFVSASSQEIIPTLNLTEENPVNLIATESTTVENIETVLPNLVETSQELNLVVENKTLTAFTDTEEEKLLDLSQTIKLVYASVNKGLWATGNLIKLSRTKAVIHPNKKIEISLHSQLKLRLGLSDSQEMSKEIYATLLEISEEENFSFVVQFTSHFPEIQKIINNLSLI